MCLLSVSLRELLDLTACEKTDAFVSADQQHKRLQFAGRKLRRQLCRRPFRLVFYPKKNDQLESQLMNGSLHSFSGPSPFSLYFLSGKNTHFFLSPLNGCVFMPRYYFYDYFYWTTARSRVGRRNFNIKRKKGGKRWASPWRFEHFSRAV